MGGAWRGPGGSGLGAELGRRELAIGVGVLGLERRGLVGALIAIAARGELGGGELAGLVGVGRVEVGAASLGGGLGRRGHLGARRRGLAARGKGEDGQGEAGSGGQGRSGHGIPLVRPTYPDL